MNKFIVNDTCNGEISYEVYSTCDLFNAISFMYFNRSSLNYEALVLEIVFDDEYCSSDGEKIW